MNRETKVKVLVIAALVVIMALLLLFMFSGNNFQLLLSIFREDMDQEEARETLRDFGFRGYITVTVMAMLQVVCTFLPAEPVQVLAGLTFGFPIGLLCCWLGVFLGNSLIYLLQRVYGDRLRSYFFRKLNLDLEKIARSGKCTLIIFLLYFLPAIPYGMICFFTATLGIKYRRYIVVTMLGSLPSVCIGVGLGHMALASNWAVSLCVFLALVILLVILAFQREKLVAILHNMAEHQNYSSRIKVQKHNPVITVVAVRLMQLFYWFKGVKIHAVNHCAQPVQSPSVILCSHGSFSDYIYAAKLLYRIRPHFVAARLYFYQRWLGFLMRKLGAFPKSMFAMDIESTRNCLQVLHEGRVLAMMPEARLSTAGRFEDIQSSTYSFLKKMKVPVYTLRFAGDYLSHPKWGSGIRRGSRVEAHLQQLYTADQIEGLSEDQIRHDVERQLFYDDFAWLKTQPQLRYRSRRLAQGLENILILCPHCRRWHTLTTRKNSIFCENCGKLTDLNDRYGFDSGFAFEDLGQWYDWQKEVLKEQILSDPNYTLTDSVELRLPGNGNTLTRHAGQGVCTLDRGGLHFKGVRDGQPFEVAFSLRRVYRLLFGAGENFEIYNGSEILYFVPGDRRSCVRWYLTSMILHDEEITEDPASE